MRKFKPNRLTGCIPNGIIAAMMDNRTLLLDTALDLFSERGYDAVGVQEIVEAVGLTKPTLYHYFGNKTGLLQAVLERDGDEMAARLEQVAAYQGDLPRSLHRLTAMFFDHARQHPAYYRLYLGLWFAPPQSEGHHQSAQLNRRLYQPIERLFEQAAAQHGNMRGRQALYAATFLGLLHSCIGMALDGSLVLDEDLAQRIVRQFQYGIYS